VATTARKASTLAISENKFVHKLCTKMRTNKRYLSIENYTNGLTTVEFNDDNNQKEEKWWFKIEEKWKMLFRNTPEGDGHIWFDVLADVCAIIDYSRKYYTKWVQLNVITRYLNWNEVNVCLLNVNKLFMRASIVSLANWIFTRFNVILAPMFL